MHAAGNQHAARAAGDAHGHEHGLGRGAAAVVEARIRIVHARQLADERLILEQGLEVALADFRLIGRVGSDEFAPRGDIIDDRRDEMVVASAAEEADAAAAPDRSSPPASLRCEVSSSSPKAGGTSSDRPSRNSCGTIAKRSSIESTPIDFSMAF